MALRQFCFLCRFPTNVPSIQGVGRSVRQKWPSSSVTFVPSSVTFVPSRHYSYDNGDHLHSFKFSDLEVNLCRPHELQPKPDPSELLFGKFFSDHMLSIEWHHGKGWSVPKIHPIRPIMLHPGSKVLHYATELFEGMKAFRGDDQELRLFRPDMNMRRMNLTAQRAALPTFDGDELIKLIKKLVLIEQEWVPHTVNASLYIRPTMIGVEPALGVSRSDSALLFVLTCPVGSYFATGFKPVTLMADPRFVRAWPGGAGDRKMGSNYAPTIMVQKEAEKAGAQQILWLFGEDHQLTEVGTMNIFLHFKTDDGGTELVTPPLDQGLILPGVTRASILELAHHFAEKENMKVTERRVTMPEVVEAAINGHLLEIFGAGTACCVCPVSKIIYMTEEIDVPQGKLAERFLKELTDIQYGRTPVPHPWAWNIRESVEERTEEVLSSTTQTV